MKLCKGAGPIRRSVAQRKTHALKRGRNTRHNNDFGYDLSPVSSS